MSSTQATDRPVLNLLATMTADAIEATTLDPKSVMLVRIAALVAVDAPPASYLMNLGAAAEVDATAEEVQGVLAAVAPIVGTARVVAAAGNIMRALALEVGALDAQAEEQARATPTR